MSFGDHWRSVEVSLIARGLAHFTIEPHATYWRWLKDKDFQTLLHQIQNKPLVDVYRLWELIQLSENSAPVTGDVLEAGVWRGGSGALLCAFNAGKEFG